MGLDAAVFTGAVCVPVPSALSNFFLEGVMGKWEGEGVAGWESCEGANFVGGELRDGQRYLSVKCARRE